MNVFDIRIACLVLTTLTIVGPASAEGFGRFHGELVYRAVQGEERVVELVAPFSFEDPQGKLWTVPPGAKVDGASIPPLAWSFVGAPFTGKYREASVIHDYYCDVKTETWQNTHVAFYNGMKANGVDSVKAFIMYAAVYSRGPRWLKVGSNSGKSEVISGMPLQASFNKIDVEDLASQPDITLEQITLYIDESLEITDLKSLQKELKSSPDCSVLISPLNSGSNSSALCNLDSASRRLLAKRNLRILIGDVQSLLSTNNQILIPQIDNYIENESDENWKLVSAATRKVRDVINFTMLSLIQYDKELINSAESGAASEFYTAARLKKVLTTRGMMLQLNITAAPRPGEELKSWKRIYLELLRRLEIQLAELEKHFQ